MVTKQEVFESLDEIRKKFDDPETKAKFAGFRRDLQFRFPDIGASYVMSIDENTNISLVEGTVEKPHVSVEMDSSTFIGIRNKTIRGTQAYMTGKLKIKGPMPDLLKLQKLL